MLYLALIIGAVILLAIMPDVFFYLLVFGAGILWLWAIQKPLGEDCHIEYCERFRREDFYYALKVWILGFIPSMLFGMVGVGVLFWLCCSLVNLNSGKYT